MVQASPPKHDIFRHDTHTSEARKNKELSHVVTTTVIIILLDRQDAFQDYDLKYWHKIQQIVIGRQKKISFGANGWLGENVGRCNCFFFFLFIYVQCLVSALVIEAYGKTQLEIGGEIGPFGLLQHKAGKLKQLTKIINYMHSDDIY